MADEQKGSQETKDASLKTDDQVAKGESQKTDKPGQKTDTGQTEYVPKQDYENLESRFGQSQTELKQTQDKNTELEKRVGKSEKFQQQVEDSFSPKQTSADERKRLTSAELRGKADLYREEFPDTAAIFDEQADNAEWRAKVDGSANTEQQLHNLWTDLSKPESSIKAESVDFKEVARIAIENKVDAKAAYGIWLGDNFDKLTSNIIEKEKSAWDEANRARTFEGDFDVPATDAEKEEIKKVQTEIGEPGQWPKET